MKCVNGLKHDFESNEDSDYCANGCGEKWYMALIKELDITIEKMKNCENCKNKPLDSDFFDSYNSGYFDPYCTKCVKRSNWELK